MQENIVNKNINDENSENEDEDEDTVSPYKIFFLFFFSVLHIFLLNFYLY